MSIHIGITGGIGSGKTLVTRIFSLLGIPVYNADDRAKWLMINDHELINRIKEHFGEASYHKDGSLNKAYLSKNVFNNKDNIIYLNSLVHPRVGADFSLWSQAQSAPYIIKEAALLFESGSYKQLDKIIMVYAPLEMRVNRTLERDKQRSREQVLAIVDNQWDDAVKMDMADFVIYNDDSQLVIPQVLKLDKLFKQ